MAKREMIDDTIVETVAGGRLTYTYNKTDKGKCGVDGDYQYTFTDVLAFIAKVGECQKAGMVDTEMTEALLNDGIIQRTGE